MCGPMGTLHAHACIHPRKQTHHAAFSLSHTHLVRTNPCYPPPLPPPLPGSMFGLGISIFAVFFLVLLATLISQDYPYAGEWFDPKGEPGHPPPPLHEQRETAVHALWVAIGMYGVLGIVSGIAVCTHKVRGAL